MFNSNSNMNVYDNEMNRLVNKLANMASDLSCEVRSVYVKSQTLKLYVASGKHWAKAKADLESARKKLESLIDDYDAEYQKAMNWKNSHWGEFNLKWSDPIDSHSLIESKLTTILDCYY